MDQPAHGFLVRPADFKRVPMYYAPVSQDVYGTEVDSQNPIHFVPATAIKDPRKSAEADRLVNSAKFREEPFYQGSYPGVYEYAPHGESPLAIQDPVDSAADRDSLYRSSRAAPTVVYEPLQRVRQTHSPQRFAAPVRSGPGENNFFRPGYDEDQLWLPRQILSQGTRRPTENFRASERYAPGRRQEVPSYDVPFSSSIPQYGYSMPYQNVEGTCPILNQSYDADDYVDPRHPSWRTPAQRVRLDLHDDPLPGAREMYPADTAVPRRNDGASLHHRFGDSYGIGREPDRSPMSLDDGNPGFISGNGFEIPGKLASIVPVDFPVSDLAKLISCPGDGHDHYSYVFYDPASGRILPHDPRRAPTGSASLPSTPSEAEVVPTRVANKSAQSGNHFHEACRAKEGHDVDSRSSINKSAPSVAGLPIVQYLLPARDSRTDLKVPGGKEAAEARVPTFSNLIPAQSRSATPSAVVDDAQGSRVPGPFYIIKPLHGSDKVKEVLDDRSAGVDGGLPTSSLSDAVVEKDENLKCSRPVYLRPLAASDKIKEVFEDGSSTSNKGFVVTRVIPVSSPDTDHLPEKAENSQSKDFGVPEEAERNDYVPRTSKNTGSKESYEKTKNSKVKEYGNTEEAVRSSGKNPKPSDDLLVKIGRAIWSSKPKEKKRVPEDVSRVDKASKHGDGVIKAKKLSTELPDGGKGIVSEPSQNSSKGIISLVGVGEKSSSDSEKGGKIKIKNPDASMSVKLEAPLPIWKIRDVHLQNSQSTTNDGKSSQDFKVIQVGTKSEDDVPAGEGHEVHRDLYPNLSNTVERQQEQPKDSSIVENAGAGTDWAEAEVLSGESVTPVKRDEQALAGEALLEEADSGESTSSKVVSSVDGQDPVPLSLDVAATRIQARYRGHVLRQAEIRKPLRTLKKVQARLRELQSRVHTDKDVRNLLENPKERLKITESVMGLLLELDTLQGVHPFVREMRKYVAREIVKFQDSIDAVMKEELELPSASSFEAEAGPSNDISEVVTDTETCSELKEEQLDNHADIVRDSSSKSEVCNPVLEAYMMRLARNDGSALHVLDHSENAVAVDDTMKEILEVPPVIEVKASLVDKIASEALKQQETSSAACSRDENNAPSGVSDRPVDNQSVSVHGETSSAPSVEDHSAKSNPVSPSEETGDLLPGVEGLLFEENSQAPSHDVQLVEIVQDVGDLSAVSQDFDINYIGTERSVEIVQEKETTSESSEIAGDSISSESSSDSVNAKEEREYHGSHDVVVDSMTDDETMENDSSASGATGCRVQAPAGHDSVEDGSNSPTLGIIEDESVAVLCDDKSLSGVGGNACTTPDEIHDSLQDRVSEAGIFMMVQDVSNSSGSASELSSSSGNENREQGMTPASETEPDPDNLSHGCPLDVTEVHGVPKDSMDDNVETSGCVRSEGRGVNNDVPIETAEIVNTDDGNVEAAGAEEINRTEFPESSQEILSGVEVQAHNFLPFSTEKVEITRIEDESVLLSVEDEACIAGLNGTADTFVAVEDQNHEGKIGGDDESQAEISDHSEVRVGVHDAVLRESSKVSLAEDDSDGATKIRKESSCEITESACENLYGEDDVPYTLPAKEIKCISIGDVDEVDHESLPQRSTEVVEIEEDDCVALMTAPSSSAIEPSKVSVEIPSTLNEALREVSIPSQNVEIELTSAHDDDVGDAVSTESSDEPSVRCDGDGCGEVTERSQVSEPSPECSSGEELGMHDVASALSADDDDSAVFESSIDNTLESEVALHEASSTLPAEQMNVTSGNEVIDGEKKVAAKTEPGRDDEASIEIAAKKSLQEAEVSRSSQYDGYCGAGESCGKSSESEDRDSLLKQLTEENRKLQVLFREVIRSTSDHKTKIQEMVDRLEKLEQLVKEQDQRKEKRRKYKKTIKH